jgi:nicotinamide mononucleotide transporter
VSTPLALGPASPPARLGYGAALLASAALILAAWAEWLALPLDRVEVLAFVSGAWTVWLAARNHLWSWPIGILNSALFVVLFWQARLFFDMGLNVFYVLSGLWGWWIWAFGGRERTEKPITKVGRAELAVLALAGTALGLAMWLGGIHIQDASPGLDAITTALSLVAQWLLMRRHLETWFFWIAADLFYIPLYLSRELPLTALLYGVFLLMCLRGLREWRSIRRAQAAVPAPAHP